MAYENFIVPNNYWDYVLEQKRITFINEFYKKNKQYPIKEDIQHIILTDEEKEKYKRIFYARYCVNGIVPNDTVKPNTPIIPPATDTGSTENPPADNEETVVINMKEDLLKSGWMELPSLNDDNLDYYYHTFEMSGETYRNYTFGLSSKDRISKWVAYPMTKEYLANNAVRSDAWFFDPIIDLNSQSDVTRTFHTYNNIRYDRGHQMPQSSRLCCESANMQCYYSTNIVPQLSYHNQYIWFEIDASIRDIAIESDECYVTTGVITDENSIIIKDCSENNVTVPNAFYKAILYKQNNIWYSFAYFTEHKAYGYADIDDAVISLYELELKTNIEYFVNLKNVVGIDEYNQIKKQRMRYVLSCVYDINTTGDTKLFITDGGDMPYNKILYNGKEISLKSDGMTRYFNFNKLGNISLEFILKENTNTLYNICFSNTRIRELIIPSNITEIKGIERTGAGLFSYDRNYIDNYIKKITSLNEEAPILNEKYSHFSSYATNGTLYVPKGSTLSYASWMGNGSTDTLLAKHGWTIKELN